MFYCNQLLARKAPLGPIWMAATMRRMKLNRRKLNELNIIRICEEILFPPVPIALRLSGILMGGVVIVYEKKVKLLYDDVNRMLEGINEVKKTKSAPDPTVLPKGKKKAKYEAVTLPDREDGDVDPMISFQRFLNMRLDNIDEAYIKINPDEEDHQYSQQDQHHQADMEEITLTEDVNLLIPSTDNRFNRYDRFETVPEEDGATFTQSDQYLHVPSVVASPPEQRPHDTSPEDRDKLARDVKSEHAEQDPRRPFPTKRKAKGSPPALVMDTEQTIIPGHIFQEWIRCTSDIVGRKKRTCSRKKVSELMELPPGAQLISGFDKITGQVHYPAPLLGLWRRSSKANLQHDSASRRTSSGEHHEPPNWPTPERERSSQRDTKEFPFDDFLGGDAIFQELKVSIEKSMAGHENMQPRAPFETTPSSGSSGQAGKTPSSTTSLGHDSLQMDVDPELPSNSRLKFMKQRPSFGKSAGSLDPVYENIPLQDPVYEDIPLQDHLYDDFPLQVTETETGPTMAPIPPAFEPPDAGMTRTIHAHLKMHFDTPGTPRVESLNHLTQGMNRTMAAKLFYQTCVLATSDVLNVEQKTAYGDIIISRGRKM